MTTTGTQKTYYVSITGLRLKSVWYMPKFMYYTSPAMQQAQSSPGNISAKGDYVNGVLHTFSIWEDRKSMTRFMAKGAHAQAMKIADSISSEYGTKVYGYETTIIPTWEEALQLWEIHGKRHGVLVPTTPPTTTKTTATKIPTNNKSNNMTMKTVLPVAIVAMVGVATSTIWF